MKTLRFLNEMVHFVQPIELAPAGLEGTENDDKPYLEGYCLLPYHEDAITARALIHAQTKGELCYPQPGQRKQMFGLPASFDEYDTKAFSQSANGLYFKWVKESMKSMANHYQYVKQAYVLINNTPLFFTLYLLVPEQTKDISCIVTFADLFGDIDQWVLPGAEKYKRQFFSRNAPLFQKLVNAYTPGVDFTSTQFLAVSGTSSFLNIPVMRQGKLLTESPFGNQFYEDVFALANNLISQYNHATKYLWPLHMEAVYLNSDTPSPCNFFTHDHMSHYLTEVKDITDDNLRNDILFEGQASRRFSFWGETPQYDENGQILERFSLINTDWSEELSSWARVLYLHQWENGLCEVSAKLGDYNLSPIFNQFDEYELEKAMPHFYKACFNGKMGLFEQGAIVQTPKMFYFRYVYKPDKDTEEEQILQKIDRLCMKILLELTKFSDYVEKRNKKEGDKKAEANTNSLTKMMLFHGLSSLFS